MHSYQSIFWRKNSVVQQAGWVLAGVILLAVASQISIPFQPVPLTFQSATVILIGMAYGARQGAWVVMTYLALGACGLPVFANGGSFERLVGPTAGYLSGFLPAVCVSGYLAQRGWSRSITRSFLAALLGAMVIFLCGAGMLSTFIGWHQAVTLGVLPFLISEPVKLLAISCLIPNLWK